MTHWGTHKLKNSPKEFERFSNFLSELIYEVNLFNSNELSQRGGEPITYYYNDTLIM